MQLNKQFLTGKARAVLPEKVLQFGTGVLLRGLPDYFIDKANKAGIFNGRIVVVKSTDKGNTDAYNEQDYLYTHCIQGILQGRRVEEYVVNDAISRVLSATGEWEQILQCATDPEMEIIISNTTEVGITLTDDNIHAATPASFPGKLLAFLLHRYQHFKGDINKGMVIIPTELIPDNGTKLKNILLELANRHQLDIAFVHWLSAANYICNSLVDRIVPGALPAAAQAVLEEKLGYQDKLTIMSEPYALWAIETADERVRKVLAFAPADSGVVLAPDINIFRELKLRLLNGTHTLSCGLAVLAGFDTVKDAMEDPAMESCIAALAQHEIVPAITDVAIREDAALRFAGSVLDRFRNPFIEHRWLSITMQYTSKMKMRVIPVIVRHYQRMEEVPALMALGFAAYLLFMRDGEVTDDYAGYFKEKWQRLEPAVLVQTVLKDTALWGVDLTQLPGFAHAVTIMTGALLTEGASSLIRRVSEETTIA
ncbi:tagaturonate reductase [Chitinophaga pinensis]|uniref:Tagaturonate reductase n=1 Tax=Chitinophaga pinensis TaxID=79329 RepID=A0A5C6LQS2_9BACT|nr:tagaturonate reductase [Chitinophaga pinensis]TWV99542.1 tagaturonate reductase [Chitinophaga pinensis]